MIRSEAKDLALELIAKYVPGWSFDFDGAATRCGLCRYSTKTISLSIHYVDGNDVEDIRDTILHEIAHAIAGPEAAHGPAWAIIAVALGASPRPCADASVAMPRGGWAASCPCGQVYRRHRQPVASYRCRRCRTPLAWAATGHLVDAAAKLSKDELAALLERVENQ